MQRSTVLLVAAALVAALPPTGFAAGEAPKPAASASSHAGHHPDAGAAVLTSGEVKQVDKSAGKITLKHGPIANLEMPGMTMVFRVKDPALLERVKAGDKVAFAAENLDGTLTLTRLEPAK